MSDSARRGPYPGLRPFDVSDSGLFFGREAQVEEVTELLRRHRFLVVLGPSGSGKSSLVRAGVLPHLRAGPTGDGSTRWRVVIARPGMDPIRNLATAIHTPGPDGLRLNETAASGSPDILASMTEATLRRSVLGLCEALRTGGQGPDDRVLVVIDQFEELFAFKREQNAHDDAAAFVKLLLQAARQASPPIGIVITMRSEYLGDCAQFRDLPQHINRGAYLVPRMTRMERREAIVGPAGEVGLDVSGRLVQRLLNDVGDDPDQLPVMQHSLMRTWQAWERAGSHGPLELGHYTGIGGMKEALSRHADEALTELTEGLDPEAAARRSHLCKRLLQAVTTVDPTHGVVRRPTRLSQIEAISGASHEEAVEIVEAFRRADRSFLMPPPGEELTKDTTIDISHESFARKWDALAEWVEEEDRAATFYVRLAEEAREHAEEDGPLRQGTRLRFTKEWLDDEFRPTEAWALRYHAGFANSLAFVERSKRAARNRIVWRAAGTVGAAALVGLAGFYGVRAAGSEQAAREARVAQEALRVEAESARAAMMQAGAVADSANAALRDALATLDTVQADASDLPLSAAPPQPLPEIRSVLRRGLPNVLSADWGVSTVRDQRDGSATPYLLVPVSGVQALAANTALTDPLNPAVWIEGGTFQMGSTEGSTDERPVHRVSVSGFWIQEHEVTNDEYRRFAPDHTFPSGQGRHPVVGVTWQQATDYAASLGGSLPTEAQWEFAARGTEGRRYPWGGAEPTCRRAQYAGCEPGGPLPVMSRFDGATPEGVHDLAGNVWEWVADRYGPYNSAALSDPVGPTTGASRVLRGGSFNFGTARLRGSDRNYDAPVPGLGVGGFRVAWPRAGGQ